MRGEYRLILSALTVGDYLRLGRDALAQDRGAGATCAGSGSSALCHVVDETSGETVGMGRLIGDGGCYFHVVDMAVLPHHQRRGIGAAAAPGRTARPLLVAHSRHELTLTHGE
jgi:hypothetical protein